MNKTINTYIQFELMYGLAYRHSAKTRVSSAVNESVWYVLGTAINEDTYKKNIKSRL